MIIELIIALVTVALIYYFFLRPAPPLASQDVSRFKPTVVLTTSNSAALLRKSPASSSRSKISSSSDSEVQVKLFFGSQTGTAEDFASTVSGELEALGLSTEVIDLEDYDPEQLSDEKFVMFFMATYGEGEPTDNGKEFWEYLSTTEADLGNVRYGVFGLGNSTYEQFNWFGRQTNKRLQELGAVAAVTYGEGDDDSTLEDDFAAWRKIMLPEVAKHFGVSVESSVKVTYKFRTKLIDAPNANVDVADSKPRFSGKPSRAGVYDVSNPAYAPIIVNRELHTEHSERSCRHVEIKLPSKITYEPGDHLGVYPYNSDQLVQSVLSRLGYDPKRVFILKSDKGETLLGPMTTAQAFRTFVDLLSVPRKSLLEHLVQYVADEGEAAKFRAYFESDLYQQYVQRNHVCFVDLLKEFPTFNPPLEAALEFLPRLQPRYYSISSAPNAEGDLLVNITVAVVEFETPLQRQHQGVCSTWLAAKKDDQVAVFVRSSSFKMPKAPETPLIMIGPGTGLAPFRGFLQHRAKQEKSAPALLFFGCRSKEHDYIYGDELEKWHADGVVELHTAFSRAQKDKDYVQHRMADENVSRRLWDLVHENKANIYICGDANKMARDVKEQWLNIFEKHGTMSRPDAEAYFEELTKNERYLQDTWT